MPLLKSEAESHQQIKQVKTELLQLKLGGADGPTCSVSPARSPRLTVHYTSVGDMFKTWALRQLQLPWSTLQCGSRTWSSQEVTTGTLCQELELLESSREQNWAGADIRASSTALLDLTVPFHEAGALTQTWQFPKGVPILGWPSRKPGGRQGKRWPG